MHGPLHHRALAMLTLGSGLLVACAGADGGAEDWSGLPHVQPEALDPRACLSFDPGGTMVVEETSTRFDAPPSTYTFGVANDCRAAIGDVLLSHALLHRAPLRLPARTTTWFTVEHPPSDRRRDIAELAYLILDGGEFIDRMHFIGRVIGPKLVLNDSYDAPFALEAQVGCRSEMSFAVLNAGELPAEVASVTSKAVEGAEFTGSFSRTPPFSLAPGDTVELTYSFAPHRLMDFTVGSVDIDYGVRGSSGISGGGVRLDAVPRDRAATSTVAVASGGTVWVQVDLAPSARVLDVQVDGEPWPEDDWSLDAQGAHVVVSGVPDGQRRITIGKEAACPD